VEQSDTEEAPIGIMADSHGQAAPIAAAIEYFGRRDCRRIFHLGDVCDSVHPETAEGCLRPLLAHGVTIVKGNNDHTLVANHADRHPVSVGASVLGTLQKLPLRVKHGKAVLAHSLPFEREFGLVNMVRSMGYVEARHFFDTHSQPILFRGHSHTPEIVWRANGRIRFEKITAGEAINLDGRMPCVITCGALTRGFCMLWKPDENVIESILLP